jgi:YNFM family putative membrane transporter
VEPSTARNPPGHPRAPNPPAGFRLQIVVFTLVSAAFTNIYITQPVLPVLAQEFAADLVQVSLTVSAVIFGIALSNLPFGWLADRASIRGIVLTGGVCVAAGGLVCAVSGSLGILVAARFAQGIFIPALTSCLAAYLARTLPAANLSVVMGAYVSATVLGGLGGRLLGGWLHPPLHWRYAFVSAAALVLAAAAHAYRVLPVEAVCTGDACRLQPSFRSLLARPELWRMYACAAGAFGVFSSIFNFLPFRMSAPPFGLSTEVTTLLYGVYVIGIFMGPIAGKLSNRFGTGATLLGGTLLLGVSLGCFLLPLLTAVVCGLLCACAGFFTVHAAAVGGLNRRLAAGQGRANALYMLFYYVGGWAGITLAGFAYAHLGWAGLIAADAVVLTVPMLGGWSEWSGRRGTGAAQ